MKNYDIAIQNGETIQTHTTFGAWNIALGKDKEAYKSKCI